MHSTGTAPRGFTLIEMSIVLVVIGLIVGGILVGLDLIRAAGVRATITQLQKYQMAVSTFRFKYDALPGDIPNPAAFGLSMGDPTSSRCLGNGQLDDFWCNGGPSLYGNGEVALFWTHLSGDTHLIEGNFTGLQSGKVALNVTFPVLRIGGGIAAYMDGNGRNWFATGVTDIYAAGALFSDMGMSAADAFRIDSKIDDGMPNSGHVLAFYSTPQGYASTLPAYNALWAGKCAMGGNLSDAYAVTNIRLSQSNGCNLHILIQ